MERPAKGNEMKGRVKVTFSIPQEQVDYTDFLKEFTNDTDRGAAISASALIDAWLADILRAFLAEGDSANWLLDIKNNGPLSTYKSRTEAVFALGLIDEEEHRNIGLIRKIRNEFAHSWRSLSFEVDPIRSFCQELAKTAPGIVADKEKSDNRIVFVYTVWNLLNQMIWRKRWAEKEKRSIQVLSATKKAYLKQGHFSGDH